MITVMHIRFGGLPECGKSWDDEEYEPGVACYRAEWHREPDVLRVFVPPRSNPVPLQDRPVYVLSGELLDQRGRDGSLLMAEAVGMCVGPVDVVSYVVECDVSVSY